MTPNTIYICCFSYCPIREYFCYIKQIIYPNLIHEYLNYHLKKHEFFNQIHLQVGHLPK